MAASAAAKHVLVVGGGACGAFHASRIHSPATGTLVSVVCRSNYAAAAERGFTIHHAPHAPRAFTPHRVFPSTAAAAASRLPFAHILVFTKATTDTVELLTPLLRRTTQTQETAPPPPPATTVSIWQNGLGVEDGVTRAFPEVPCASVVMYVGMSIDDSDPTLVRAVPLQRAVMGPAVPAPSPSSSPSSAADSDASAAAAAAAAAAAIPAPIRDLHGLLTSPPTSLNVTLVPDIRPTRWHKSLWNATFGLVGLAAGLIREIVAAAERVLGRALPLAELGDEDELVRLTRGIGAYKASVLLDWERGRELEAEVLFGEVLRRGTAAGVDMPRMEALYAVVRLMIDQRAKALAAAAAGASTTTTTTTTTAAAADAVAADAGKVE
ncbi:hypothetical protein DFJ73DRAFT_785686 [Zopfochytrium polystomum]|nr:hypothetical protein DFJ73DRAFT_785686 [Zopfochytrium polystomum]